MSGRAALVRRAGRLGSVMFLARRVRGDGRATPAASAARSRDVRSARRDESGGYNVGNFRFLTRTPMSTIPACPHCALENTYPDGENYVCADCGHEWPIAVAAATTDVDDGVVKDANGNVLQDGDTVVLIKDLKVKGSSITLKMGTKVKNIRLASGDHAVDGKVDGSSFMLKAEFLKKV